MMTGPSRLRKVTASLSLRLFLVVFLAVFILISVHAAISSGFERNTLEQHLRSDAERVSVLIHQSLYTSMLRNERERTSTTINLISNAPSVEAIRIYDKSGVIRFSNTDDVGVSVDLGSPMCNSCHAPDVPLDRVPPELNAQLHETEHGYRVMEFVAPIRNSDGCSDGTCHAHAPEQTVLGMLEVQLSMQAVDATLTTSRRRTLTLAGGVIFLAALFMAGIVYQGVHLPTRRLRHGADALAEGDLDVEIDLRRSDELGALAESFNEMARRLKVARTEREAWSRTLEERVKQKTDELEEVHQQMIQVEKTASLGKMAATVAHELNNPLSGILTYAKLVARRLGTAMSPGEERARILENLELIRSESMRCGNIVRDLLTYAREHKAEFREAHIHELAERALKLTSHHTKLSEIATETDFRLEDDRVVCDAEQIVQALIALMINAVEAMPDGGRLTVTTRAALHDPARRVTISVTDTGVGIPKDARERVFDPFYSTKTEAKGVGLGLAVVYGIVQRHEGRINLASNPGTGTTFTIELPRDPDAAARERAQLVNHTARSET